MVDRVLVNVQGKCCGASRVQTDIFILVLIYVYEISGGIKKCSHQVVTFPGLSRVIRNRDMNIVVIAV